MTLTNRLLVLIEQRPNLTQQELAEALWGKNADSRGLIDELGVLRQLKLIERRGVGGAGDPYQYRRIKL